MKWIRGKTQWHTLCAMCLLFVMLCSVFCVPVYADPTDGDDPYKKYDNTPVEHLVVVSDTDWWLAELEQALKIEEAEDQEGNEESDKQYHQNEANDHRFVAWSNNREELKSRVLSAVTDLRGTFPDSNVAVIFWNGFWQVNDVTTFTHEILEKVELDAFQKDTERYSYEVENPDTGETETLWGERVVDTDEKQFTYEIGTETCHERASKRYADVAKDLKDELSKIKVKDYWVGLPPNAIREDGVLKDGIDVYKDKYTTTEKIDGSGYKDYDELYGYWAKRWNQALSTAGTVIDIWDAAHDSKLYFTENVHMLGSGYQGEKIGPFTGTPSGEWKDGNTLNPDDPVEDVVTKPGDNEWDDVDAQIDANPNTYAFYSYNDETYQTLFHIVLDHIQNINPLKESDEAVAQDMYSISTGLTAYVNKALSPNADEKQSDHKILETKYVGNAGALLGYGDEKKGFVESLVTDLSKTSSTVAYQALKGDSQLDDAYLYANYGKLLSEMGIDEYGVKSAGFSIRGFSGAIMLLVYVLSLTAAKLFGFFVDALILLNPFRFFVAIDSSLKTGLQQAVVNADQGLSDGVIGLVVTPAFTKIATLISNIYNALQEWSWELMVPVGIAMTMVGLFLGSKLFKQQGESSQAKKVWMLCGRILFVAIGVPFLGILYTSTLASLDTGTADTKSASTQIVASTYVDFAGWVEKYRLDPIQGGTFALDTESGNPTKDTLANLRETALAINVATGAVDANIKGDDGVTGENDMDWSYNALTHGSSVDNAVIKQCFDLITGYMNDGFYYPSDWEAAVGQAMHHMASSGEYETGRRKGGDEENFDAEAVQGEDTYYHMYDNINELDDWNGRELEDNSAIFDETKDKYKGFNILNNGRDITNSSVEDNVLIYEPTFTSGAKSGKYPTEAGGLSTLSMYNYLSTRFHPNNMVMYSNEHATNVASRYSHYAVTMIGEGFLGFLYWANSFILMLVIAIIGLCYFIGGVINVLKKGMTVFTSLPGAALGVLKSIATILSTTFSMIMEIIMMGLLFTILSELLVAFVAVINKVVLNVIQGGDGILTTINLFGSTTWTISVETLVGAGLVVSTLGVLLFGIFVWYYRRAWNVCVEHVVCYVCEVTVPSEVHCVMQEQAQCKKENDSFISVFLANVWEMLYTKEVQGV